MTLPTGAVKTKTVAGFVVQYIHDQELTAIVEDIFGAGDYRFDSHRRSPRILDCGAHIGLSVLYFKRRFPDARITAFEPSPDTFELLTSNVRGNGFSDVELVNSAVSDRSGTLDFYVPRKIGRAHV